LTRSISQIEGGRAMTGRRSSRSATVVKWIEDSIRSVFWPDASTGRNHIIVVDDGSTDDGTGAAIVERLANERPITLLRKPNGGQSSARNFGVALSSSARAAAYGRAHNCRGRGSVTSSSIQENINRGGVSLN
jgi:Glycosyl transferase family 2